jgi:HemY protein
MAEIEEAAANEGAVREWLNRAARAPRDRAWVADSVISDHWSPVSPSGVLDAFVWRTPDERLSAPEAVAPPSPPAPEPVAAAAPPPAAIEPPPPAPPAAPAPPQVTLPRGNNAAIMLSSTAPDDPGPHNALNRDAGYRMFASE